MIYRCILTLCLIIASNSTFATGVYLAPNDFIADVFDNEPPEAKRLWIKKDLKLSIRKIMDRDLGVLRLRYWQKDDRTAWILEEIGKEKPITTGIVISDDKIEELRILVFRESRGWEIRYPFFTDQFKQARLTADNQLNKKIDAITGATLSKNAMVKVSRLALYLTDYIQNN